MKDKHYLVTFARKLGLTSLIIAFVALASATGIVNAQSTSSDAYRTAVNYVTTFYPLWFTYNQSQKAVLNQLVGPSSVTPLYQTVVAVNVDTLYASSFMYLPPNNAAILTIPPNPTITCTNNPALSSPLTFSVLNLDPYGNVLQPNVLGPNGKVIQTGVTFQPGIYAFVGPGYQPSSQNPLPSGATVLQLNITYPSIIFRIDKYSSANCDQTNAAETFRSSLQMQSLVVPNTTDPPSPDAQIVPELPSYAIPFKALADTELTFTPMLFLSQLMKAVSGPNSHAQPLTSNETALSEQFNELYNSGVVAADLAAGAIAAHQQIVQNYLEHRDANGWIDYTNIGDWGSDVLDRASITEFLQFGNDFDAAAYFHVFMDANGQALDGAKSGYVIHFPAGQPPAAKRFWSITAYTPEAVELVPNALQKYNVASYTPGLTENSDGSLTIYVGTSQPEGAPEANYLPVPLGPFNLLMRFYGPEGQVAKKTYVPPSVTPQN